MSPSKWLRHTLPRRLWSPLLLGLGGWLLGWSLQPYWFRDPRLSLTLAGVGLGAIAAAWRYRCAGWRLQPEPRQTAVLAVTVAMLLLPSWPSPQGDEPHYLLVAHSLVNDRDLDLADEYGDRDYAAFHPDRLSPHYKPGLRPGSRYSMHGVGYPLLLAPAYGLGTLWSPAAGVWSARLTQVGLLGLFAMLLHLLVAELAGAPAAAAAAPLAVLTVPLLLAPLHLFPETAAMTAAVGGYVLLLRRGRELYAGVTIAMLPWLGVKYIPLAFAVAFGGWLATRRQPRDMVRIGAPLAAALAAHVLFTWTVYGSLSPSAVYLGSDPTFARQPGFGTDWAAYLAEWPRALATLIGYFLDAKEGLLAVAPFYLLGAAGIPVLAPRRPRVAVGLGLIAAAHLLPYALSQQLGGQSPPARPVTAVLWTLVPFVAVGLLLRGPAWLRACRGALLAASVAITLVLALDPTLLPHDYPVKESWLLRSVTPLDADLWAWFPQWVNYEAPNVGVTAVWLVVAVALAAALAAVGQRSGGSPDLPDGSPPNGAVPEPSPAAWIAAAIVVGASSVVSLAVAQTPISDRHGAAELAPGVRAWVRDSVPEDAWAEPGGVWVRPGDGREIVLTSARPIDSAMIHLRVLVPATVRLNIEGQRIQDRLRPGEPWRREVRFAPGRRWRGRHAYRVVLQASAGGVPALIEGGDDWRQLGVELRLEAVHGSG